MRSRREVTQELLKFYRMKDEFSDKFEKDKILIKIKMLEWVLEGGPKSKNKSK